MSRFRDNRVWLCFAPFLWAGQTAAEFARYVYYVRAERPWRVFFLYHKQTTLDLLVTRAQMLILIQTDAVIYHMYLFEDQRKCLEAKYDAHVDLINWTCFRAAIDAFVRDWCISGFNWIYKLNLEYLFILPPVPDDCLSGSALQVDGWGWPERPSALGRNIRRFHHHPGGHHSW